MGVNLKHEALSCTNVEHAYKLCHIHSNYNHVMCFYCLLLCLVYANSKGTNIFTIPGFTTQQLFSSAGNTVTTGNEGIF